ncbi:MAG: polysaccharide biosynthesis C-terminal domain-containing protein, partial [Proteobacteria bacterium]|nr:polysaccharide biosynthesis C-terminal domain-containing protein [Pseudomonadota bacterium]
MIFRRAHLLLALKIARFQTPFHCQWLKPHRSDFFLALVMMALGKYFLMLFGENFTSGASLIWILGLGIVFRASVGPAESVLTMSGQQNTCAIVYVATLLVNIVLNWSLIPHYGLHGAAIATTA